MKMMKINEFSMKSGFSIRMLRYLEEKQLLSPIRGKNHYRMYSEVHLKVAKEIKYLQQLGLNLKELKK